LGSIRRKIESAKALLEQWGYEVKLKPVNVIWPKKAESTSTPSWIGGNDPNITVTFSGDETPNGIPDGY
jgi:hypothetical protein